MSSTAPAELAIIVYPTSAGGILTRVLECGAGDDVVIFLHGSGARADRWRRNLRGFAARGYRALAIDFPGHGFASKLPGHRYDSPSFAEVVADFVKGLGVGEVTLVGTSLGAHVAALYACQERLAVRAAVLVGPLGLVPVERDPQATSSRIADTSADGVAGKLRMLLSDHSLVTDEWVEEERRINTSPGAAEALGRLRSYLADGVKDDIVGRRYADLGIPTLLVWGAEDNWVAPRYGLEASRLLGGAPLVYFEGTGHAPYLERADDFNALLAEFLSGPSSFPGGVQRR